VIAGKYGFKDWKAIYDHPSNADFRRRRPNPHLILPGDRIAIPDKGPPAPPSFKNEFSLDPTCGVAFRSSPSLVSHQPLQQSGIEKDYILLQDENEFLGTGLYRAIVGWGWIALPVAWVALLLAAKRRDVGGP
jgi:hypothetical protein